MTFLSYKREWKLSCVYSPNRQSFIEMPEEHPLNSNFWYNTGSFSVVSPMFNNRNCSVDNCLCWLNKKGLDDCKKITVKSKWNSISNAEELSIVYCPCFYYYELILSTFQDVNLEPSSVPFSHIFFSTQRLINMKMYDKQLYANVEDLLV